jgi:CDP-diacylglycerol--glycerol-3-phosphate 3-phosphatidyltransferase
VRTTKVLLAITGSRLLFSAAFAGAALAGHAAPLLPLAVLIELSDMTDGIVARRTGTASVVGNVYDGMADLLAKMTQFISFAAIGAIGLAPVVLILWPEVLVVTAQRVASATDARVRHDRVSGKLKGIIQGASVLWLSAAQSAPSITDAIGDWTSTLAIWLAVTVTLLFGIDYVLAQRAAIRGSVASRDAASG